MEETLTQTKKVTGKLDAFTDKYFLRSKEILQKDQLNPYVRAQVFVRKGPGVVKGLDEAVELIRNNSPLEENGGKIFALKDGDTYSPKETLMVIEGRIDDIIELETTYLGVLAAGITKENDGVEPNYKDITEKTRRIKDKLDYRNLSYFGARHWHYNNDFDIAAAAMKGGATSASTDMGASYAGQVGVGTIPHALENIYAFYHGKENAVKEATLAFDRRMPEDVARIALIDYNNKEITDSIETAHALQGKLYGVRVDTCGENIPQGGLETFAQANDFFDRDMSDVPKEFQKYYAGTGVTISGVYALREALDAYGHEDVKIILTSGFGNEEKVSAFVDAEKRLGVKLFEALGVGSLYQSRTATMDIVAVGVDEDNLIPLSKVGREYQPNERLERRL